MSEPDMVESDGDHAQIRIIAKQLAKATLVEVREEEANKPGMSRFLQWTLGIMGGVLTALVTAGCLWTVSTLSDMKTAVATIQLRVGPDGAIAAQMNELRSRVDRLEMEQRDHK